MVDNLIDSAFLGFGVEGGRSSNENLCWHRENYFLWGLDNIEA